VISQQCHFVDDAGRRCRGRAIVGLKYCTWHRQDGGPRPTKSAHQIWTPSLAKTNPEKLAEIMLRLARIKNRTGRAHNPTTILWLVKRYGHHLDRLFELLSQEASAGRSVDKLVKQASGPALQTILRRERQKNLVDPDVRPPRYWAIFGFITAYIARYRRSPARSEIAAAVGMRVGKNLAEYLAQLEQDGLLIRLTKPRNTRAFYVSPKIKERL
jgi:hypothetical protein